MNTMQTFSLVLLAVISQMALANPDGLIAHYPLTSTPNDTTGRMGALQLVNAPFKEGSLYCNGTFFGDSACQMWTPVLPSSIFQAFSVSVKFKVDSLPFNNPWKESPVLMGGVGWRWMGGMVRTDTTVSIRYNNDSTQLSHLHFSLHTWHEMTFTYDTSRVLGCLYLDSTLACSVVFVMNHGPYGDAEFGISDHARGTTFKGYLRDLMIFSSILNPTSVRSNPNATPEAFQLLQNYPNPFNPSTTIKFVLPSRTHVILSVYNILGEQVATLVDGTQDAGYHEVRFDGSTLASGVYFYRWRAGDYAATKRMLILK